MRRLLIGFILLFSLFAISVQAQQSRVEDWMLWLYLPDSGDLLFKGFYEQQGDTIQLVPVSFERHIQMPERARNLPKTVVVSDDASSLAYAVNTSSPVSDSPDTAYFAEIVVSEVLTQGFYEHEVRTFDANTVSLAFHSTAKIRDLGHTLYHKQQRLPALASQYPDRERKIAYAYQSVSNTWRIEVYDANKDQLLYQFEPDTIPELDAERVVVHRYQDDSVVFSAITGGEEHLYELSLTDNSVSELPLFALSSQSSDFIPETNEALSVNGDSLLYYQNFDAQGTEIFTGDSPLSLPRFVQNNQRIVFMNGSNLDLIERASSSLVVELPRTNLTQIVSVPTGFVYITETDSYSSVMYYHSLSHDFDSQDLTMWSDYENPTPVQAIFVHQAK